MCWYFRALCCMQKKVHLYLLDRKKDPLMTEWVVHLYNYQRLSFFVQLQTLDGLYLQSCFKIHVQCIFQDTNLSTLGQYCNKHVYIPFIIVAEFQQAQIISRFLNKQGYKEQSLSTLNSSFVEKGMSFGSGKVFAKGCFSIPSGCY